MSKQNTPNILDNYRKIKIQLYFTVTAITVGTLLLFLLLGYIIDTLFLTNPYGKIAGAVIAFPVIQILIYKKVKNLNGRN